MAEQRPYRISGFSGMRGWPCETARRAFTGRSVHRDQLGHNTARGERAPPCVVVGNRFSTEGRGIRAVVVDCLVDPWTGLRNWSRLETVRPRGALPNGGHDGGLLRGYRDGAARLVRERL